MKEKAAAVGQRIRSVRRDPQLFLVFRTVLDSLWYFVSQECGVNTAIKAIYQYINRAGSDRTALD